jgi:CHAT domain-containing protein/tetratricopeptide (TPR) repeat protein
MEAEEYLLQLLEIADSIPGGYNAIYVVDVLTSLSYMYGAQARYDEAEQRIAQALELYDFAGIRENANKSSLHKNLGNIYMDLDRLEDARDAYWRAYEIRSRICGADSVGLAESLNNLGLLYIRMGQYGEAEQHLRRALRLRSDMLGAEHTYNVYPLTGLGKLFTVMAEYDTADAYYERALEICLNRYDEDHLHTGWCYKGLADTRRFRGMYSEAESLYERSLSVAKNALGQENTEVADILLSLAYLHGSTGEYAEARAAYKRMLGSRHEFIERQFIAATESQKLRFLGIHPLIINSLFSLALVDSSAESRELAMEMVLKGKAVVLDAVAAMKEIAWCSGEEDLRAMAEQWQDVSSRISELTITRANVGDIGDIVSRLDSLAMVRDSLEYVLSVQCSEAALKLREREFTLLDVASALEENQALCEIVKYEPYDFSLVGCDTCRMGPQRYVALTLDHSGEVRIYDLGYAAEIDSLVTLTRNIIYDVGESLDVYSEKGHSLEADLRQVTSKLRELVFMPLEPGFAGITELFISPDGDLNLLPFEILPASNDSFIVEKYSISYLSAGRDVLAYDDEETCNKTVVLIASPDFDSAAVAVGSGDKSSIYQIPFSSLGRISRQGADDCLTDDFYDLPSGAIEAEVIGELLSSKTDLSVRIYLGPDAREQVIKEVSRPYLIHVSTHGFFCENVDATSVYEMDHVLQRSGLVLAGSHNTIRNPGHNSTGTDDGILTAFEVSECDLSGTELVVLSACETGIGEVKNSEGVFGLRRSFQHAGVRSMIMSLWKVSDGETLDIMKSFYDLWLTEGFSRKEALRRSVLKMIEQNRNLRFPNHPAIWGAFVYAGDPD